MDIPSYTISEKKVKMLRYSKYKPGYKYRVEQDITIDVPEILGMCCKTDWIELADDGFLHIKKGYCWDGASGPTIDTKSSMRGSLAHDALYQLIRLTLLQAHYKLHADWILRRLCITDGMWVWRANRWFGAVQRFGKGAATPRKVKVLEAP